MGRFLVDDKSLASLACKRRLNGSALMYHKERLAKAIQEHMGADIIIQIQHRARWKDSLAGTNDRLACRDEGRHL